MKPFSTITRLDVSIPGYPHGKPKNATSETSKDGTVINDIYLNDQFQFFAKCVRDSGIIPDNNFDNGDTIYQLFTAVQKAILDDSGWLSDGIVYGAGVEWLSFVYRKSNGFLHLYGNVKCTSYLSVNATILTLPEGYITTDTEILKFYENTGTGVWTERQGYCGTTGVLSTGTAIAANRQLKFSVSYKI